MSQDSAIVVASGEAIRYSEQFSPSFLFTHLKVSVVITESRVIVRQPNTIFGIIPRGYIEETSPLQHISQISAGESYSTKRLAYGGFAALMALFSLVGTVAGGALGLLIAIVLAAVAAVLFLTAHSMGITFRNHGGGLLVANASRTERIQIDNARVTINALLFGNNAVPTPASSAPPGPAPEFTAAQASDPSTPQATLARIAETQPSLRPLVATNPNTYPGLVDWLRNLGDPAVDEALRARV